jgi:Ala-tRNA(Pro) deacylase
MTTALTLTQYLTRRRAAYDMLPHEPTQSSIQTAQACHVPPDCVAKAVVLHEDGGYLLAVLPASHHLRMQELEAQRHRPVSLATEDEIAWLFPDCEPGAVPPIGAAYGVNTIVDDSIADKADVYFEGGDHATLVHMSGPAFRRMTADAQHGRFSNHD